MANTNASHDKSMTSETKIDLPPKIEHTQLTTAEIQALYDKAATALGWRWSVPHLALVNDCHRRKGGMFFVEAATPEAACAIEGILNAGDARHIIATRSRKLAA